ncbi:hypothetical protein [Burkholderia cenocepacia]|uniref:hypothetical protein n=1 Tax=Burkholderia cenocepacia TaxID=95486 RepID=UPI000AAD50D4|nr:hypothetical protein [Burkholderia cenocepacia]
MIKEPRKELETLYASISFLRKTVLKEQAGIQADLIAGKSRYKSLPKGKRDTARFMHKLALRSQYHRAATLLGRIERSMRALLQNPVSNSKRGTWNFQTALQFEELFRAAEETIFDKSGSTVTGLPAVVVNRIAELPYSQEIGLYLVQIPKGRRVPLWMGSLPTLPTGEPQNPELMREKASALFHRIKEAMADLSKDEEALLNAALLGEAA